VLNVNNRNKERVIVVQQLENMAYWVSCDTLMAQEIATDDNTGTPETEVLTLRRVAWEREDQNNHQHIDSFVVCYTYDDLEIRRHETIVTNEYDSHGSFIQASESQSSILVATHITNVSLAPMFDDNLMVTLTSSFGNTSETRTYQIVPRVDS